jgi:hypothetical protein
MSRRDLTHRDVAGPPRRKGGVGLRPIVHGPQGTQVARRRRRGRWLTTGLPWALGVVFGTSSFVVLGVASLIGGSGLLVPLLAGLGVGVVLGGGTALLLRNRRPARARRLPADAEMADGTRSTFTTILQATAKERKHIAQVDRPGLPAPVRPTLARAESLLERIDTLLNSSALQSRRAYDPDVLMLEGMATRYVPDLVESLDDTLGFLASFDGGREAAAANVEIIDQQLTVLDDRITRIEADVVGGLSRSLDVQREFLTRHVAEKVENPLSEP